MQDWGNPAFIGADWNLKAGEPREIEATLYSFRGFRRLGWGSWGFEQVVGEGWVGVVGRVCGWVGGWVVVVEREEGGVEVVWWWWEVGRSGGGVVGEW